MKERSHYDLLIKLFVTVVTTNSGHHVPGSKAEHIHINRFLQETRKISWISPLILLLTKRLYGSISRNPADKLNGNEKK